MSLVNPDAPLQDYQARHLLRRTGFGPLPKDFQNIQGRTRGEAADFVLDFRAKPFKPGGRDFERMHNKWFKFILKSKTPLLSKLALFWHDHFSVGFTKVQDVKLMAGYVQVLHTYANGNFKDFVKAMNKNPAMMEYLDTVRNDDDVPNENCARELQELFTLGVKDLATPPQNNYTQADIVQIARAFTGWRYDDHGNAFLDERTHDFESDFPERGPKVIYQSTGGFGAAGRDFSDQGEGAGEIDRVIDIIFDHVDSTGKNTVARRTAYRLCEYFAHASPDITQFVDDVVAYSSFDTTFEIAPLLRAIFCHDNFYLTAEGPASYTATGKKSVKWPIDYVASTLRLLQMKPKGKFYQIRGGSFSSVLDHLTGMGQVIGDPPSVFGWDWEAGWVSSATLLARFNFARDITSARDGGGSFRPEKLVDLSLSDPDDIIDAAAAVLGLQDHLKDADKINLRVYLTNNGADPTLDLNDFDTRNEKLNGLFALLMESPAYQLH
jgi:uncharacterized protein (DUF1800 family)